MLTMLKTIKNIPRRVANATKYSLDGLKSAYRKEESIRLEFLGFGLLILIMLIVPWPLWKKAVMVAAFLLIPLCELLNSAIEDVCDLISRDYQENIKLAKDEGSAAVLVALIINLLVLAALILV